MGSKTLDTSTLESLLVFSVILCFLITGFQCISLQAQIDIVETAQWWLVRVGGRMEPITKNIPSWWTSYRVNALVCIFFNLSINRDWFEFCWDYFWHIDTLPSERSHRLIHIHKKENLDRHCNHLMLLVTLDHSYLSHCYLAAYVWLSSINTWWTEK